MSVLDSLKDIPLNDNGLIIGAIISAISLFLGNFFGFLRFRFPSAAATAVQEATAINITAEAFEKLMSQSLETQQQLMATTSTFTQFVADTRKRTDEREEKYAGQVKALEKSVIDGQTQITDLNGRIENLKLIQEGLSRENDIKEIRISEQEKRITVLEESEKQAHRLVVEKDLKITALENRVRELEAEIARLKASQGQPPVAALVAAIGATSEPAKNDPLLTIFNPNPDDDPDKPKPPKVSLTPEQQLEEQAKKDNDELPRAAGF